MEQEKILNEATFGTSILSKSAIRANEARRVAHTVSVAAKKATKEGNTELAAELIAKAEELNRLADEADQNTIAERNPEESENSKSSGGEDSSDNEENASGEDDGEGKGSKSDKDDNKEGSSKKSQSGEQDEEQNDDGTLKDGSKGNRNEPGKDSPAQAPNENGGTFNMPQNKGQVSNTPTNGSDGQSSSGNQQGGQDGGNDGGQENDQEENDDGQQGANAQNNQQQGGQQGNDDEDDNNKNNQNKKKVNPFDDSDYKNNWNGGSGGGSSGGGSQGGSQGGGSGGGQQQPQEPPEEMTLEEIIAYLSKLTGEARRGAIAALKDILGDKINSIPGVSESLHEGAEPKPLVTMTDDEFNDYLNGALELADKTIKINYIPGEKERGEKIKTWADDPNVLHGLQNEDDIEIQQGFQRVKAQENEIEKYSGYSTLSDFYVDFYYTIKNQVEMVEQEYQTYNEIDPVADDEGAIWKADVVREVPDDAIPIIDVYLDKSGSWAHDDEATEIGDQAIATLKEFVDRGEIKVNLFYFDDIVTQDRRDPRLGKGGTRGWPEILQNIKTTNAKNVMILTDCDVEAEAAVSGSLSVDGCVWFVWNLNYYTAGSASARRHLTGKMGTKQYSFGKNS